jgi:hypothetical protein
MKFLSRSILLMSMFIMSFSSAVAGQEQIQWLKDKFKKNPEFYSCFGSSAPYVEAVTMTIQEKFSARGPDSIIQLIADKALKEAGIIKPIIVLQCKSGNGCLVATYGNPSVEYLIVDTGNNLSLKQITASIYHEIGHIAYGDNLSDKRTQRELCYLSSIPLFYLMPKITDFFQQITGNGSSASVAATGILYALFHTSVVEFAYQFMQKRKEKRADEFGYNLLLQTGQVDTVVERVVNFSLRAERKESLLESIFSTHPKDINRANMGFRILKEHSIDDSYVQNLYRKRYEELRRQIPSEDVQKFYLKPYVENRFNK